MGLEAAIHQRLTSDTGIAAAVAGRIRPLAMGADDALPFVVYRVTGRTSDPDLAGEISDYRRAEFETAVYGRGYDDVGAIADLIRDRLDQCGATVAGVEFAPIEYVDETDDEEATDEGDEFPTFVRVLTFRTLYKLVA